MNALLRRLIAKQVTKCQCICAAAEYCASTPEAIAKAENKLARLEKLHAFIVRTYSRYQRIKMYQPRNQN